MAQDNERPNPFDELDPYNHAHSDLIEIGKLTLPIIEHAIHCEGECDYDQCAQCKTDISHIEQCQNSSDCDFERCQIFKDLYNHINSCFWFNCRICPISAFARNDQMRLRRLCAPLRRENQNEESNGSEIVEESDENAQEEPEEPWQEGQWEEGQWEDDDWDSDESFFMVGDN